MANQTRLKYSFVLRVTTRNSLVFIYNCAGFINMNLELKENLIEMVREYECLYNLRHKDYKNATYKQLLWEKIGASIGVPGPKAKDMWRTLRDGYIRYKKTVKGPTGSSRKYSNYTWSAQMTFLDGSLELRPIGSNVAPTLESKADLQPLLPGPIQSPPSSSTEAPPSCPSSPQPTTSSSPLPSAPHTRRRKNDNDTGIYNTDRVLEYPRNKKIREWDSVDHLFMSYAKTFRQLSVRNQGKVKVALAQMFSEAELDELEQNASNVLNEPNTQPSSPAKSVKEEPVNYF